MRFWQNRFLNGQTTSDETVLKMFITKQILVGNCFDEEFGKDFDEEFDKDFDEDFEF